MRANSNMVTRIIVKFESFTGRYVWHCHVLEHGDDTALRSDLRLKITRKLSLRCATTVARVIEAVQKRDYSIADAGTITARLQAA